MRNLRQSFARSTQAKRQQQKMKIALAAVAGVGLIVIGMPLLPKKYGIWLGQMTSWLPFQEQSSNEVNSPSEVLALGSQSATERSEKLEAIASGRKSLDRNRARYLLATEAITQKQGKQALSWLEKLEWDYPLLGPQILLKRAQAYEVMGDAAQAKSAWQDLLDTYGDRSTAPAALTALGRKSPKDWEAVIAKFPSHPRTLEMVDAWLQENPNQPKLSVLLAKNGFNLPRIIPALDQLMNRPGSKLKPEDWEAIAWVYWEKQEYGKASHAYDLAPRTARNAYRIARGLQLSSKKLEARKAYRKLISEFPNDKETAVGLIRLASLSDSSEAVLYLEEVIARFPDQAAIALAEKAKIFDKTNPESAAAARQLLVNQYGNSDAAAEYRWTLAERQAATGNFQEAWQWAQQIKTQNPNSELARKAAFWEGKWANRLGKKQEAKTAFEYVLSKYPQSYYAWRSAVFLGWDVGDFKTVRQMNPQIVVPKERSLLPVGSAMLKELYRLGEDLDAWTVWQAEFQNQMQPSVAEQFTEGLLRIGMGDHLGGISEISRLEDRETPEERASVQALKQQIEYGHGLYPFLYRAAIETWSSDRHLNPLLVTGLIRQESRFEPTIRSNIGAVGLMQVMPNTASWTAQNIKLKQYQLDNPNDNVQIGTWFLEHSHKIYNNDSLLAVASYNGGSGNVAKWLQDKGAGDPDEFVEAIPFEETRNYVKNVFGNYWNYLRLYNPEIFQQVAKYSSSQPTALK